MSLAQEVKGRFGLAVVLLVALLGCSRATMSRVALDGTQDGASSTDAGAAEASRPDNPAANDQGAALPANPLPSCGDLPRTCGQGGSCCSMIAVPGGRFPMGRGEGWTDGTCRMAEACNHTESPEHEVSIEPFLLDEYEVTVGRFRRYVDAFDGTAPAQAAGAVASVPGTGWRRIWDRHLPPTQAALRESLACGRDQTDGTWTNEPGERETHPINCVSWYQAQAFCIWEGARLPTESEWEYVATGGEANRPYPWGREHPRECLLANRSGCSGISAVGGTTGTSRWGHADLIGNVGEWVFDWFARDWYEDPLASGEHVCNTMGGYGRGVRGGAFDDQRYRLYSVSRAYAEPHKRLQSVGFRCARDAARSSASDVERHAKDERTAVPLAKNVCRLLEHRDRDPDPNELARVLPLARGGFLGVAAKTPGLEAATRTRLAKLGVEQFALLDCKSSIALFVPGRFTPSDVRPLLLDDVRYRVSRLIEPRRWIALFDAGRISATHEARLWCSLLDPAADDFARCVQAEEQRLGFRRYNRKNRDIK